MANQQTDSDKFEELCAGYVLHALEEEERKEFEQMLSEASDEERTLYQEMWSAANQLAFTFEPSAPSPELKDRLMDEIRAQEDKADTKGADNISSIDDTQDPGDDDFNWSAFAVAASFALIVVCLSLIFYSFNLSSTITEKEEVIAKKETTITELKSELQRKEEMLSILEAREIDLVMMAGLEVNPSGYGKIIWNAERQQALLQVSNLPTVPEDKDYQLWLIKDNKPVSAGVFAVKDEKDKFFKIEEMAEATEQSANAFAVTMEPKGGVPQPTGDMYLMGNVNNE
ncbi:anti-sigma factor [Fodinibius saliphilus]|uniref:anti-sigma factor n=1 Tax=Fodinibius saliphilus TaxID=1920650 RepID=UPI0011089C10|nr:anti-sigma factor [Fodinibius saliphilus]